MITGDIIVPVAFRCLAQRPNSESQKLGKILSLEHSTLFPTQVDQRNAEVI